MNVQTLDRSTTTSVFHLVHFVGGQAVPYVPYASTCSSCCGASSDTQPTQSCCH